MYKEAIKVLEYVQNTLESAGMAAYYLANYGTTESSMIRQLVGGRSVQKA